MRKNVCFLLLTLQLVFVAVNCSFPLAGGWRTQSTAITPELSALVNIALKQVNDLGSEYAIQEPTEVIVMKYSTQVVAGMNSALLMEVRFQEGSKLVSTITWDQPWTGINNRLTEGCVYTIPSGNFFGSQCNSVEDCQTLLADNGVCQELDV